MKLWIDNTTLHGAGRCLTGEGRTLRDLRALLQLATLVVFAERMEVGQFEQGDVVATSSAVRAALLSYGLETAALDIIDTSEGDYLVAARSTAASMAAELPFRFREDEAWVLGLSDLDIPAGTTFRPDRLTWLATEVTDPEVLEEVARTSVPEKAMGAVDYMLATSEPLRSEVRRLIKKAPAWTAVQSFQLESMLRALLNDELARQRGNIYAPAPHRGELIDRQNLWILRQLNDTVDDAVTHLRGEPLGAPAIVQALVSRSRGDTTGVIREALSMREQAAPLRQKLARLQAGISRGTEGRYKAWRELQEMGRALRSDLALEHASGEALALEFSVGLPSMSLKPSALAGWLRDRLSRSQRALLTNLAKSTAFLESPQDDLRRLTAAALRADAAEAELKLLR